MHPLVLLLLPRTCAVCRLPADAASPDRATGELARITRARASEALKTAGHRVAGTSARQGGCTTPRLLDPSWADVLALVTMVPPPASSIQYDSVADRAPR